jgi:hypothetical protein
MLTTIGLYNWEATPGPRVQINDHRDLTARPKGSDVQLAIRAQTKKVIDQNFWPRLPGGDRPALITHEIFYAMTQPQNFPGVGLLQNVGLVQETNAALYALLEKYAEHLERMEAEDVGFVGAFQMEPSRDPAKMQGKKRPFMGSFFWHLKEPVLSHMSFKDFWQHYKASSSKYATIRRGERRFTHHLLDAGVAVKGMYSRQQFDRWLDQANDYDVRNTLRELSVADPRLEGLRKTLLSQDLDSPKNQTEAKNLVRAITASQNIMATAPLFMVRDHGLPFLKKSTDETNLLALDTLCVYFEDKPDWIVPEVLQEMRAVVVAQRSL